MSTKKTIKTTLLKHAVVELEEYCHLTNKYDSLSITYWNNGEGFDVDIYRKGSGEKRYSLTWGEFDAIKAIIKTLNKS